MPWPVVVGQTSITRTKASTIYYDLSNDQPLLIGFGAHDYFNGLMSDLRLYNRALTEPEIIGLATTL